MAPLSLAEDLIERKPGLLILDLRGDTEEERGVPGAVAAGDPARALEVLTGTPDGTVVVVYDESGVIDQTPPGWPTAMEYRYLEGGLNGWRSEVMTPAPLWVNSLAERERVQRQNQISAFFSGAAVQSSGVAAPPPMMPAGGAGKKPKAGGGC
jgi:hypothetical protein